jgi:hypothetical protein
MCGPLLRGIPDVQGRALAYRCQHRPSTEGYPEVGTVKVKVHPHVLVRDVVLAEYDPVEDSIKIVREKRAGKDAAFAVAFEDRKGLQRRGLVGLCRHHSKTWQPSGRSLGSVKVIGPRDVWMTWGGWGPGNKAERAVAGGWVADPAAVSARLVDSTTGRVFDDEVENGVFVFMWKGDLNLQTSRLDLLDGHGGLLRSGPMMRRAR